MGKSKRRALLFVQKEIKTYRALALFLSKQETRTPHSTIVEDRARLGRKEILISKTFYEQRIYEAEKLVSELRGAH